VCTEHNKNANIITAAAIMTNTATTTATITTNTTWENAPAFN
jgi:hypothetical protein